MKRKSIITMAASLALVGALGVGATLAYLSDGNEKVTNTFTVGNVDIELVEFNGTDTNDAGFEYKLLPGDTVTKKPYVTVAATSEDCYVFMNVDGIDENSLFTVTGWNNAWNNIEGADKNGKDGIYMYNATNTKGELPELFNTVTYSLDATGTETLSAITVEAFAIQAANVSVDYAKAEAVKAFN